MRVRQSRRVVGAVVASLTMGVVTVPVSLPAMSATNEKPSSATESDIPVPMAAAASEAARSHRPVPVDGLINETSEVVALPEGGYKLTSSRLPVRVKKDNRWVAVDDKLVRNPNGSYSPAAATVGLTFSGGGTGPLVTMGDGRGAMSLTWPRPLPTPVIDGDTATYADVMPGVDLNLIAAPFGYKQLITVKTAEAAKNPALDAMTMVARADGVKLSTQADGALVVTDEKGAVVMAGPQPYQWDATHSPDSPTEENTGTGQATRVKVQSGPADGRVRPSSTEVVIRPDLAELRNPATTFPVRIDPSLSKIDAHYLTLYSNGWKDYDDTAEPMRVGKCYNVQGYCGSTAFVTRSYFSFDVSLLTGQSTTAQIYSGSVIASQVHNASCSATPVTLWSASAFTSSTNWDGTNSTALETKSSSGGACGSGSPADISFSGDAVEQQFRNAADRDIKTLYFGLISPDESNWNYWKKFDNNPQISVVYDFGVDAPTALNVSNKVMCGTTPFTNVSQPTFYAKANNINPTISTVDLVFWIYANPNTGSSLYTSGEITHVPENQSYPWQSPAALPNGNYYLVVAAQSDSPTNTDRVATSAKYYFSVDTSTPATPTVWSSDYPEKAWGAPANRNGSFQLTTTRPDVVGFSYGIDVAPSTVEATNCNYAVSTGLTGYVKAANGEAAFTPVPSLSVGYHTLTVRAFTGAHHMTPESAVYVFYVAQPDPTGSAGNPYKTEGEATLPPLQPAGQGDSRYNGGAGLPTYREVNASTWNLDFSGGADVHMVIPTPGAGVKFGYRFSVPVSGYYALGARMHAYTHFAKAQFTLDGESTPMDKGDAVKTPLELDTYSATRTTKFISLGGRNLSAGQHTLWISAPSANGAAARFTFNGTYGVGTTATITNLPAYSLGLDHLSASLLNGVAYPNLQQAFNNNGITATGEASDIEVAGTNRSIDSAQLAAPVTVGGVTFTRDAEVAGKDNVIAVGQTITVNQSATAVHFLVASTCFATPKAVANQISMRFTGQTDPEDLPTTQVVPEWLATPDTTMNRLVLGGLKTGTTIDTTKKPVLYSLTYQVPENGLILESITLPVTGASSIPTTGCLNPALHVFAMKVV